MDNILEYENLVRSIINRYSYYGDYEDLYQAGMMGLAKALKNYKERDAKFSSYAYDYIIGEVTSFMRDNTNLRLSRDMYKLSKRIEKCRELMYQKLGRKPTDLEISLITEIEEDKIHEIDILTKTVESLDYVKEERENDLYNSVKVFDNNLDSSHLDLKEELNKLPEEERKLIYDRYYKGYTQSELSKELGISQVQVSRKETKILQKLKVKL